MPLSPRSKTSKRPSYRVADARTVPQAERGTAGGKGRCCRERGLMRVHVSARAAGLNRTLDRTGEPA